MSTRAIVLHPFDPGAAGGRTPEAMVEEAVGLAAAIALDVVCAEAWPLRAPRAATLLPRGQVERLALMTEAADLVILDADLTPLQQRNLERAVKAKVIDRTGLILEIFGARARTREGRLQVELAALSFQRSRLVRSWTHLERQRGGFGFLGGPGESQLEIDRRLIDDRIAKIRRALETVARTRGLHRKRRDRRGAPTVALVGYTNAGKSTLFNRLTDAGVKAEDQLFATLDPTMRRLALPGGPSAVLSDTVGFVSRLPTLLVSAFHATLEEVVAADLVLHVRDVAHPDSVAQKEDVEAVLTALGRPPDPACVIELWNKIDATAQEDRALLRRRAEAEGAHAVSAITGEGMDRLRAAIADALFPDARFFDVFVAYAQGGLLSALHDRGAVAERVDEADGVRVRVRLGRGDADRLAAQGAAVTPIDAVHARGAA